MRITFFLATLLLLFPLQKAEAQTKPDVLFLTDGTAQRVVIRGQNASRNLIQYTLWGSGSEQIISRDLGTVHKIVYSYGVEKVYNPLESSEDDSNILDDLFGGVEGIQDDVLSVPNVENTKLLLTDDTETTLNDFSWTSRRLKLLRPSHFQRSRRSRYSSSYQPAPQWEEIQTSYVKGIVLPGRIRLHVIREAMTTINDSTGWVEMRNGLKYAAEGIEIRDRKVTFVEYYTKKIFKWDAADVNFLVWENQSGAIDFVRPGEGSIDGTDGMDNGYDSDSRGVDEGTDNSNGQPQIGNGSNNNQGSSPGSRNPANTGMYSLKAQPEEFSPLPYPMHVPSSILRTKVNPARISTSSNDRSLFPRGSSAENMGEVKARLEYLFEEKNFQNLRYFPIEGGFVMLTPVEKFNEDGSSSSFYKRFDIKAKAEASGDFTQMIRNISFQEEGFYRMFAVAVTDQDRPYGSTSSTKIKGLTDLGQENRKIGVSARHKVTFMVYEWTQLKPGEKANLKDRGSNKYSAYNHLKFSGILDLMTK